LNDDLMMYLYEAFKTADHFLTTQNPRL